MGQRLVTTIYKEMDETDPLVNVYQHWSAYTVPALEEARAFVKAYQEVERSDSTKLDVIKAYESIGVMVPNDNDVKYISDTYNHECPRDNVNRNIGLLSCTKDTMEKTEGYGEGFMNIYLDNEFVDNNCYWYYTCDNSEIEKLHGQNCKIFTIYRNDNEDKCYLTQQENDDIDFTCIKYNGYLEGIDFDKLDDVYSFLYNIENMGITHVYDNSNTILEMIM